ncbi:hypothetical protein [Actinokineospora globicatena]|uniref:hypothetical protein n=1 Tax=Actinokineospora globicatena TaxID=103729 RepID=UPI00255572A9|nr:hypothetical protein [Actinokineospora globicatena]
MTSSASPRARGAHDQQVEVVTRDGYLGDSTRAEIAYAEAAGKPVTVWDLRGSDPGGDGDLREQVARALDESLSDFISPDEVGGGYDVDTRQAAEIALSVVSPLLAERDRLAYDQASLQRMADWCRAKDWAEIARLRGLVGSEESIPAEWAGCPRNEVIRQATVLRRTVTNLDGEVERLRGELTSALAEQAQALAQVERLQGIRDDRDVTLADQRTRHRALADALGVTTDGTPASYYQLVQAVVDLRAVRDSLVRDLELALWPGDPAVDRPLDTRWNAALTEVRGRTEQLDVTRAVLSAVHVALIEAVDDPWLGWSELPRAVATLSSQDTTPPQDGEAARLRAALEHALDGMHMMSGWVEMVDGPDSDPRTYIKHAENALAPGVSAEDTTPATPRVWALPAEPTDGTIVRDYDGSIWTRSKGGWYLGSNTRNPCTWAEIFEYSPLTEVLPEPAPVSPQEDTTDWKRAADAMLGRGLHADGCCDEDTTEGRSG